MIYSMIRDNGISYYCNLASPYVLDQEALKYIDYDLDVKVFADGEKKLLDVDEYEIHKKEMFFSSKLDGQTLTFWRDKERTQKEMLELSPEDEKEINKLIKYVSMAESMTVPIEKPFDAMNLIDFMKLGMSMKSMRK